MKEYKYCLRCRRPLKNPEARQRGFGDICWKKMQSSGKNKLFQITKTTLHTDK